MDNTKQMLSAPNESVIDADKALEILGYAFTLVNKLGKAGVVTVVSSQSRRVAQFAMNGITPYNAFLSEQKAKQAAWVTRRTRYIRDSVADPSHPYTPAFLNISPQEFVPWAGGVPVFGPDLTPLGGVGVCITTEDEDEEVAIAAVEAAGFLSDRP